MKRWLVKGEFEQPLRLYYRTLEEVQMKYPNCTIEEDTDNSHVEYINKILELSVNQMIDYRGRLIHKIPHNAGYILVRIGYDGEDDTYYDFLEYQRHDEASMLSPITWTWGNPKQFYEDFLMDCNIEKTSIRLSDKDLKKIKPKVIKFYNKNNNVYWIDDIGYIYIAEKHDLPNKKSKEEWDKFHDNPNAVFMWYTEPPYGNHQSKWFVDIESFNAFFDELKSGANMSLHYEIKRRGYKALHPQDRNNIFRLPYFNIEKEYRLDESLNKANGYNSLARKWAKMCQGYSWFGEWYSQIDFLEDVIKQYFEWKNKI